MARFLNLSKKAFAAVLRAAALVVVFCVILWLVLHLVDEAAVFPWQAIESARAAFHISSRSSSTSHAAGIDVALQRVGPIRKTQLPEMLGLSGSMLGPGDADAFFQPDEEDNNIPFTPEDPSMKVAICLTGEARDFQLTGPSIIHNLLPAYPNPHLFLHTVLDEKAYRFLALAWAPPSVVIAGIRIFPLDSMDERKCLYGMVSNKKTPSCQAILQQYRLIQGCISLIRAYENANDYRFNWIVRTRADSFWSRPPPPLKDMAPGALIVPHGSDCGGLNDRLAMGQWKTARIAMSRLALLPHVYAQNNSLNKLNPESVLSSELELFDVSIGRAHYWFCIVSRKLYDSIYGMPVPSMLSGYKVPLNGAKCRPCTPYKVGMEANETLEASDPRTRPPVTEGLELCNASSVWEEGWETIFDETVGPDLAGMRKRIDVAGNDDCVAAFKQLKARAWNWDSPTPEILCLQRTLGGATLLGDKGESFFTLVDFLIEHPRELLGRKSVKVVLQVDEMFRFSLNRSEATTEQPPTNSTWYVSLNHKLQEKGLTVSSDIISPAEGTGSGVESDLHLLVVSDVQLVHLVNTWSMSKVPPKTCQLLVAVHSGHGKRGKRLRLEVTRVLRLWGFQVSSCIQDPHDDVERCTYFSTNYCT